MTGAYLGGLQFSAGLDLGTVTANSTGPVLNAGGSSYVKGSWFQIVASLTRDTSWMMFYIETLNSSGTNYSVDIGIGAAASEIVIVNNLFFSGQTSGAVRYLFPLSIPAGTRVAARASGDGSPGGGLTIGFTAFSDTYQSAGCGSAIDTYGFSSSTNLGTAVNAGASANTKGAYAQITASTTSDISGIFATFDLQNNTTGSTAAQSFLIDIAVGGSGSEVVIVPNVFMSVFLTGACSMLIGYLPYLPIQIPAGSRISARTQCSTNVSPDRIMGCTVFGVRL